jgi:hypothetical protein
VLDNVTLLAGAWALHPEHGINVIIGTLPHNKRDGSPIIFPVPVFPIFNDQEDKAVAANVTNPDKVPAGVLWGASSPETSPPQGYAVAKDCMCCLAFVTDGAEDPVKAQFWCGLFLRAGAISFRRYNTKRLAEGYRTLNGIEVHKMSSVVEHRVTATTGQRKMWGFLELHFWAVDNII